LILKKIRGFKIRRGVKFQAFIQQTLQQALALHQQQGCLKMVRTIALWITLFAASAAQAMDGLSDVTTSGALDRGATESLSRSSSDRSNTNLNPSDPRIGQNSRDVGGSINKVDRSDRNSVINRGRW
jgi:hypothetical protein